MFTPRYFIRVIKSIAYMCTLFLAIFTLMHLLNEKENPIAFIDFIKQSSWKQIIMFSILFGLVYPLIAFNSKEVTLTTPFEEQRKDVCTVMESFKYILSSDRDHVLYFRLKSSFQRISHLFGEDEISIDYSQEYLVKIQGQHSETRRIGNRIKYMNAVPETPDTNE